jgi:thioredoxin reductase (NADPH)
MFTPEELRLAKIFACLDEAECARLAHTIADVRLKPGEWLAREGEPACFFVILQGRLRVVLDVHGKQTEFAGFEGNEGDFVGEVPLLMGTPFFWLYTSYDSVPYRSPRKTTVFSFDSRF